MQHGLQHVQFFEHHGQGFAGVHRGLAPALAGGVLLHGGFQVFANADVVHHQAALLVFKDPVHAGNGLHQVVALHGLVHIQGVYAGRVKTREPHVTHDHQLERIFGVLETLFQPFLGLAAVNVRAQQRLVACAARHHDLDRALLRVVAVPVGTQLGDLVVQVHANLTAHGHHHGFAVLGVVALFKVRHQVCRHAGDARLGTHHLF